MRDILFRAKAINRTGYERSNYKNGEWVYGLITKLYSEEYDFPAEITDTRGISGIEVDYKTIGQYTGLTDKNGVKIFEGDIVLKRTRFKKEPCEVVFSFGTFHCGFGWGSSTAEHPYTLDDKRIEVIGNIYDNPELLEEESDGEQ